MNHAAIGVDIGGSHVSCAACDVNGQTLLKDTLAEHDLDNHAPAGEILGIWGKTLQETMDKAGRQNVEGIGFAMPGPFDYVKGIPLFTGANQKYEHLYGVDVSKTLRDFLELPDEFPVRFINDATAFAIGEDWLGNAKGFSRSLCITLGTGFGSAFLKEGLPVVKGNEVPEMGCLYHLPFDGGTADDYFSTRGLVDRYNKMTGNQVTGAREIAEAAKTEDAAKKVFHDFGSRLVELLEPWIRKFGVEVLVIGGNISNAFELFGPSLDESLKKEGFDVVVLTSYLQESAAMAGSARLIEESFWKRVKPLLEDM
ncbi:MAG: ROK family protein [Bacteroidota bacterium]